MRQLADPNSINQIVLFLWLPIFILWAITSSATKRTVDSKSAGQARAAVLFVWFAWWLLFSHGFQQPPLSQRFLTPTPTTIALGFGLTVIGLGFAVWARFSIGRNWSREIELKEDHQLIHHGPYAIVRHPIYAGFMLATLGSAIVFADRSGLLSFLMIVVAWGYKARLEEQAMIEKFGPEYEHYRQRVKGLIPFVW